MRWRSTTATFIPAPARRNAKDGPAWPVPMMIASKSGMTCRSSRKRRYCNKRLLISFYVAAGQGAASTTSKIESNVTLGLAAADQQIARRRRLDWVRLVDDGAGNQPRLAVMTNSGAARPAYRHIARLGQFEQAVEGGTPMDGEIAARKGYKRADLRSFPRRMWRPLRERGDAGRHRRARPEILGVQAIVGDPPACKAVDETAHKRGWTADVEVRIGRDAHFLEHLHAHAPHPVKIDRRPIGWLWRTVTNVAAACGQGREELAHLRRK